LNKRWNAGRNSPKNQIEKVEYNFYQTRKEIVMSERFVYTEIKRNFGGFLF